MLSRPAAFGRRRHETRQDGHNQEPKEHRTQRDNQQHEKNGDMSLLTVTRRVNDLNRMPPRTLGAARADLGRHLNTQVGSVTQWICLTRSLTKKSLNLHCSRCEWVIFRMTYQMNRHLSLVTTRCAPSIGNLRSGDRRQRILRNTRSHTFHTSRGARHVCLLGVPTTLILDAIQFPPTSETRRLQRCTSTTYTCARDEDNRQE